MADVTAIVEELRQEIPDLLVEHQIPGLAIGICDASKRLWSAGFGTTRAGGDQPVSTSTMFSVQSTSKMYTATAVMVAVQDGLVDLDEPITTYLPEFTVRSRFETAPERRMTLRHLLSHTAGFTHEAPVGSNFLAGKASFPAHCRSISDTWLRFPVGHHYEYSNLGIDLAGYILQRRSGLAFHEFVRRNLLVPLGLLRTTFDHRVIARETDRAIGHSARVRRLPLRVPMVPAAGLYASVDDALRYVRFHLRTGEQLLDPDLLGEMYRIPFPAPGQRSGYGLGVDFGTWDPGVLAYNHGGSGFGFQCILAWVPSAGLGIVVLTNSLDQRLPLTLGERVIRSLVDVPAAAPEPVPPAVAVTPDDLARFAGEYVGRETMTLVHDGTQVWQDVGGEKKPLRVVGRDRCVQEDSPRQRFRLLDDGEYGYLQCIDDGTTYYRNDPVSRRPPAGPGPDPQWHGEYALTMNGVSVATVVLRGADGASFLTIGDLSRRLDYHAPGIYHLCDGEVLDLTRTPPTLANIPLRRTHPRQS
ncbi:serine hydrolase domain-containing protein [Actinopolymorpha sp. B9G3]|uniref:serine hydrolase domain-containing protein n=1 Tax=Actinopolymorpha sp. B9G3 TaxID=3158970 RepID=UPI0032D958E0